MAQRWLYRASETRVPQTWLELYFMQDRTHNGVPYRILNVIDEYTRECLTAKVARRLTHKDVLEVLRAWCAQGHSTRPNS